MSDRRAKFKARAPGLRLRDSFNNIETDAQHHLAGPFRPQTPLNAQYDSPVNSPASPAGRLDPWSTKSAGFVADLCSSRWVVVPWSSFKLLLIVVVLYCNWEVVTPYVAPGTPNPFAPLLFISHYIPTSSPDDPRYAKGYLDLVFIAYYIVFWSWVRQVVTLHRIMSQLPTWWYHYPHWDMKPELKCYYLMQAAYWCQQLVVLLLNLEKPRKDYAELVAHHFVTLWLVGWSYLVNLTLIGNAVYLSMDVPDAFLAFSKLLNYIQWERAKTISFVIFMFIWSYFRHWMNLVMLYSVWTEFDLMPEISKRWSPKDGVWMVWWMKYQIFAPILLLQFLNLFWYALIWRIALRAIFDAQPNITDERSDDEGEDEPDDDDKED
ncbi:hypothetical protein EVJ58_g10825 [Rhodofomes roseus]|uniref:TLC domain-containing protein n=1 Tax=Rhodofomes roseus TaxID=34475 RepID=A0A4Y9XNI2_9APHY|nr:hypothetical protein EVJ58_g10825 [Rhodofomes roseus]